MENNENIKNNKENFYVFLDVDGVLNDFLTIPGLHKFGGMFVKHTDSNTFNRESIQAVNYLLKVLDTKYNVKLVLSSFWRLNFEKAKSVLKNNGLEYEGEIGRTSNLRGKKRAIEILRYLAEHEDRNVTQNFLTIDDKGHLPKYFKDQNSIKTNIINGSLTMSDILNYLDKYQTEVAKQNPLKDEYGFEQEM